MSDWGEWPLCNECWKQREPDRQPARLLVTEDEICALCGRPTRSGIYVRMHRSEVQFAEEEN